jgi:predicted Zn-dependent protease
MNKWIEKLSNLIGPMKQKCPYEFKFNLTISDLNCFRYANSMGTQNTSINSLSLSLIMAEPLAGGGARMATVSSSEFNPEVLLEEAMVAIPESPVNKEFKGFCRNDVSYSEAKTWYKETADLDSRKKALILEDLRKKHPDKWLGGIFETEETQTAIAGSNGLFLSDKYTRFTFEVKAEKDSKSTSVYRIGRDISQLNIEKECERAFLYLEKEVPKAVPSDGTYRIVFGPEAVSEICFFISLLGFGGRGHKQGSNFTSKKVGEYLFRNPLILLSDNSKNPLTLTKNHDEWGFPRKSLTLLDGGRVCDIAHNQFTAETEDGNTGHGNKGMAMLMELQEGDRTIDELCLEEDKTIVISRFHYPTIADRSKPVIKGSTKDGTYLFEGTAGNVKDAGTLEFFFNPVLLFANTKALSRDRFVIPQGSLSMSMAGANVVPWIAVDGVTVRNGKIYLQD